MVKTLPEVEKAIAEYQKHIRDLGRIAQEGSSEGQAAAREKLKKVRSDLDLLLKQRARLSTGFGQYDSLLATKLPPSNRNQHKIIHMLRQLLLDEYLQRDIYETYSYYLFGLCSSDLQKHLQEHRAHEDKHIQVLNRYLMGLRAEPLLKRLPVPKINPPIGNLLMADLELELVAVEHYSNAVLMLDEMRDPRFVSLRVDLENILSEEQEHVHDLQQWLRTNILSDEARAAGKSC